MLKYDKDGNLKTVNEKTKTKYTGDMPERYIEHFRNGGSTPQFCREVDIDRGTLIDWCNKYPAMAEAKIKGKILAEGWWLNQAQRHLTQETSKEGNTSYTSKLDTSLYKFIMGGRFKHSSDKSLLDEINKIKAQLEALDVSLNKTSQISPEPEYDVIDGDDSKAE